MNNNEVKKTDRKALPKFIIVLVISMIIGGAVGFCAAFYGINALVPYMQKAGDFFGLNIAPWLLLALVVILPVICIPIYKKAIKILSLWDGENEEISEAFEEKLSAIIKISSYCSIISCFLIAASYSGGFSIFENDGNMLPFLMSVIAFMAILFEGIIIQQRCINAARKTNPEKNVSVYDFKFQKKMLDKCDEAEKLLIGRCTLKAFTATNNVCNLLAMLLAVAALVFGIGFLPSLSVCIIWFVNQAAYFKEAKKYRNVGNNTSNLK